MHDTFVRFMHCFKYRIIDYVLLATLTSLSEDISVSVLSSTNYTTCIEFSIQSKKCIIAFTPLVFTSTGGIGHKSTVFYRRLADPLAIH